MEVFARYSITEINIINYKKSERKYGIKNVFVFVLVSDILPKLWLVNL